MSSNLNHDNSGRNSHAHAGMPSGRETLFYTGLGIGIAVACFLVFKSWPDLDLDISRHFTNEESRFYLRTDEFIRDFRKGVLFLIFGFYALVIGGWIDAYNKQKPVLGHEWHRWSFLGAAGLFGTVLIVNVIFKGNWGRSRPQHLEEFGGELQYTDFWVWSDQCRDNCSFSSGEVAAVAMVFLSIAFVMGPMWRIIFMVIGLAVSVLIAWKRIAMGSHFLSDTVMSVSFMLLSVCFVYWIYYLRPAKWIDKFDEMQLRKLARKAEQEDGAK